MQIDISFKHLKPSESMKERATEKSARLKRYFEGKIAVVWNFSEDNGKGIAHCHLVGNRMDFFAEAKSDGGNFYVAIDHVLAKIERQIKKRKDIVKDHIHGRGRAKQEIRRKMMEEAA